MDFSAVGALTVFLELFDVLFPDVVPKGGVALAFVVGGASFLYGGARAWPRPIQETYQSPNTMIRIIKGDLLEQETHLVIGMTDTFDTLTPHIIAPNSLQAQLLNRVFDGDLTALDAQLAAALGGVIPVGSVVKEGKTEKYPLGTVAALRDHSRRYFCVAYTEMNEQNEARATVDGIWRSLATLWRAVSAHGNGQAVSIPVVGGGQARISQALPAQDAVRLTVLSFMFASRVEKLCDELRGVVIPEEYARLDRLELQAFLRSLKRS